MKLFLLLSLFFSTYQTITAQSIEYLVDNWYLRSFHFEGHEVYVDSIEGLQQGPTMIILSDFTLYGKGFCNDYQGEYEFVDYAPLAIPSTFEPRNLIRGTENCGDFEAMENHFFIPFSEELLSDIVVAGQTGEDKFMVLQYSSFGYHTFVNFPVLNVNDTPLKYLIVYPNPAQNELIIQSVIDRFDFVSIIDVTGKIVLSENNFHSKKIDISHLKSGMYFLNIKSSQGNITEKFIKN